MKVMYGPYPANLSELLSQTDNIDMRRGTLQKDVDRVAKPGFPACAKANGGSMRRSGHSRSSQLRFNWGLATPNDCHDWPIAAACNSGSRPPGANALQFW